LEREIAAEKENLAVTLRSIGDGVIKQRMCKANIMINQAARKRDRLDRRRKLKGSREIFFKNFD